MEPCLVDMHVHTNQSACANITLEETLDLLIGRVDAIVVTNHDELLNYSESLLDGLKIKYGIKVLTPAVEISTLQGHLLAYGIKAVPSYYSDAKEVIEIIHSDGGVAIAAHPFALLGLDDLVFSLDIDAIEINGSRSSRINQMATEAADSMGLPLIGGSDSHTSYHVGTCVTKFNHKIETMQDVIDAVNKGNCSALSMSYRGRKI